MCGLKAGLPRKGPWGNRLLPPDPVTWQSHMTLRGTATFQGASHTEPTKSGIHLGKTLASLACTPLRNTHHAPQRHRSANVEGGKRRTEGNTPFTEETRGFVPKRQGAPMVKRLHSLVTEEMQRPWRPGSFVHPAVLQTAASTQRTSRLFCREGYRNEESQDGKAEDPGPHVQPQD